MDNAPAEPVVAATQVEAYSPTVAALADLRARFADVVFDVATPEGMDAARKARAEVKGYRVALEKKRVEIKAPALAFSKLIDTEAARITAALEAIEDPIHCQIKEKEDADQRRKEAAANAEADRVAGIRKKLDWIRDRPAAMIGKTAAEIDAACLAVMQIPLSEELFGEFVTDATSTVAVASEKLSGMAAAARANEAEAARLAAAAADLKRREDAVAAIEAAAKKKREDEAARDKAIRDRLDNLSRAGDAICDSPSMFVKPEAIEAAIATIESKTVDVEGFGDFVPAAESIRAGVLSRLRAKLVAVRQAEADAKLLSESKRVDDGYREADEAKARDPWAALCTIAEIADDPGKSDSIARGEMYEEAIRVARAAGVSILPEDEG